MPDSASTSTPIIPRTRWWWLGLALLILLAAWLYYRGYNASLPYIDNPNEPAFNLAAQTIIDTGSARPISFDAYPPGIISLNYLLIKFFKADGAHFSAILPLLRLITISVWMICVALIALIGIQLARPITGLIAAAIWVVNPWIVGSVRFAEANGFVTCFALLSLWLALVGVLHFRRSFSSAAIYSIMIATVFKTQALFLIPLIWGLPLANLGRHPTQRNEILRLQFWNGAKCGVFLFWLLLLYPTLEADLIPFWVAPSHSISVPSLQTLWANLGLVLSSFEPSAIWLGLPLMIVLLFRHRQQVNLIATATLIFAAAAWLFGVSLFGRQQARQFYVLATQLALLYALALTGLFLVLEATVAGLDVYRLPAQVQKSMPCAIAAGILLAILAPAFRQSNQIAHNFTLPDRRNDLARFMDTSLEPGLYISTHDNHKTFNRS